ncbi:MAG: YkgJ family cysteine cluster protein [Halioglobus sp.]|nr:YkgJ family cysteine cluster protein [Halioglobus sp.]
MQCRTDCGACCIAISIHQPFDGMPNGKPAGVRCVHLSPAMRCNVFGDARRPALCDAFKPEVQYCGDNREQALTRLAQLEIDSMPASIAAEVHND